MQLVQDDQQLQIVHVVICLMIFIWFVLHKMVAVNDQRGQIMREVDMSFPRCGCVWHGGVWDAPFYECPMVQWVWGVVLVFYRMAPLMQRGLQWLIFLIRPVNSIGLWFGEDQRASIIKTHIQKRLEYFSNKYQ